jgi:SAM-dependent methyltransferase
VLDLGAGSKPYEQLFINSKEYIGVDVEVSGHDHSSSKIEVYYDGHTIPFEDRYFDSAVSFETFEHVFNLDEVVEELNRVLVPEGKLLISIPFAWDEHEKPYDFARYTSFGITSILERHGFSVLEIRKSTSYFLAIAQLFIAYIFQHVLPKQIVLKAVMQVLLIFPLTALALIFNYLFPRRDEYFSNLVILAEKN